MMMMVMNRGEKITPEEEQRLLAADSRRAEQSRLQNQIDFNEGLIQGTMVTAIP